MRERFQFRIPCEPVAMQTLRQHVVTRLEELRFPAREIFGFRLSLEETLRNSIQAIRGGGQMAVTISIDHERRRATVEATLI